MGQASDRRSHCQGHSGRRYCDGYRAACWSAERGGAGRTNGAALFSVALFLVPIRSLVQSARVPIDLVLTILRSCTIQLSLSPLRSSAYLRRAYDECRDERLAPAQRH